MKGAVRLRGRARQDLIDIFRYYAVQSGLETANRLLRQVEATFGRLAAEPALGTYYDADHPAFATVRFLTIPRFKKYLIFYRPVAEGIEVVRLLHGARDIAGILAEELGVGLEADEPPD
jgi:toxin ParE1/3/4